LPEFGEGVCSIQDETAQLAAIVIAPRPGDSVLDACAAPGGKACHLKEFAPLADITALDVSEDRLERIRENTERLSLDIKIQCGDATQMAALNPNQQFDVILADVPCSATGVLRRNPDIKLLRRTTDAVEF
jgi:16S rRNA (cytosine967-C5)-methyltransferase